jgi:hypothetical protein
MRVYVVEYKSSMEVRLVVTTSSFTRCKCITIDNYCVLSSSYLICNIKKGAVTVRFGLAADSHVALVGWLVGWYGGV